MLTPQEVSTHVFSKARMGGYNMAMVDEFLDTLTEDYTTLYKENAALKAKLKVLVDKVEEYRATEDSMRATLLTAQKMASQMVQEAEKEKADLLAAAESEMGARKAALEAEIAAESERLRLAKEESAAFIANMRRLCSSELEFLDGVPEIQVNAPSAQAAQETSVDERCTPLSPPSFPLLPNLRRRRRQRRRQKPCQRRALPQRKLRRWKRKGPVRMLPRIWKLHAALISAT